MQRILRTAPLSAPRLRFLRALMPWIGLAGGALATVQQWAAGREPLAIGLLMVLTGLWLSRPWRIGGVSCGELQLDADGHALWQSTPGAASSRFVPQQWFGAAGLVWLSGESDGQRHRLVFSRHAMASDDWTALQRWLIWLDRGGSACKTAGMPPSDARRA